MDLQVTLFLRGIEQTVHGKHCIHVERLAEFLASPVGKETSGQQIRDFFSSLALLCEHGVSGMLASV